MRKRSRGLLGTVTLGLVIMAMVVVVAAPVLAHHPVISASAECEDDGSISVTGTASSWNGNTEAKKTNPSIEVHRDSYSGDLVTNPGDGYFAADNGFSFDWSDTLPAGTTGTVTYVVIATAPWASGEPPRGEGRLHPSQTVVVELPECEVPIEVAVQVTPGVCRFEDQLSLTTVAVLIDPTGGATVTILDGDGVVGGPFTGDGEVVLEPGTYSWNAQAVDGFVLVGDGGGEFTTTACPPPPPPPPPPPTGAIGDLVWEDTNADGYQGDFEAGVAGVTVHLLDGSGLIMATTVTDATGNYLFSGLSAGTYEVQFIVPDGFEVSPANAAVDTADSDAGVVARTGTITLTSGEIDLTWDAGIYRTPEVLPQVITTTTTTTAPAAPVETLPFTGSAADGLGGGIGAAMVLLGTLAVLAARRREDREEGSVS